LEPSYVIGKELQPIISIAEPLMLSRHCGGRLA
jgi:hypothetical protein